MKIRQCNAKAWTGSGGVILLEHSILLQQEIKGMQQQHRGLGKDAAQLSGTGSQITCLAAANINDAVALLNGAVTSLAKFPRASGPMKAPILIPRLCILSRIQANGCTLTASN